MIGSDQEIALRKALMCCFPKATLLLCSNHLKENVRHYLTDNIGCTNTDRIRIQKKIFGTNGLVRSVCEDQFERGINNLIFYFYKYPKFKDYFDSRLKSSLWNYVCVPHAKAKMDTLWTNNNCESLNHILKLTIDWKPQKLPELIEKICNVSTLQMLDLRRALHGEGNYIISSNLDKYLVPKEVWDQKTKDEKRDYLWCFISRKPYNENTKMYDKNKIFSIPKTFGIAKKPYQRKRPRSERAV